MSGNSSSFELLDARIQRFIWSEGWASLREAQERAAPFVLKADQDVIVAAATAAGKTEAAFLPALTHLVNQDDLGVIVYVSPLKALINDQFGRLDRLCDQLDVPVWPWHGDIPASTKSKFLKKPRGVLLITPESLEALLCNRGTSVAGIFGRAAYFVIDELHAFIGSERGKQLQSLMHRIERATNRTVPRIGLSATLGDMRLAAEFLRPGKGAGVVIVDSKSEGNDLRIMVKGYEEPLVLVRPAQDEEAEPVTPAQIAAHLYKVLRGSNNLIFPNSRREVERFTHLLNEMCKNQQVPNEFWPHHGSLSKEIRADTEAALKQKVVPASAICTSTLELGIDIGAVKCVAQIEPPPSVASIRQRLGRSGRRPGEPAILRGYCTETALGEKSTLMDQLRMSTVQMIAMVQLLIESWFEPPAAGGLHLSTLVQQILSMIAQNGGASMGELYGTLCAPATPFAGVSKEEFVALIRQLGAKDLVVQDSSGALLHGPVGERFVNHYSFYAAFAADEEFRLVAGGKTLGTLPVSQMLTPKQRILFAGKTWKVEEIDEKSRTIFVKRTKGGVPPAFVSGTGQVHSNVRKRMRDLLESEDVPIFLDETAKRFLKEARGSYRARNLSREFLVDLGRELLILTWMGDAANEALACLMRSKGMTVAISGPGIEVQKEQRSILEIMQVLLDATSGEPPSLEEMLADVSNLEREKWDWALPPALLRKAFASLHLNVPEALAWAGELHADVIAAQSATSSRDDFDVDPVQEDAEEF